MMDKEQALRNKMDNLYHSIDVILEGIRSTLKESPEFDLHEEVKIKEKDEKPMVVEPKWRE